MASGSRMRESVPTSDADGSVKRKSCALDFDTLECPICLEPLAAPVYQCQNGHTACRGCCKKLSAGLCPTCLLPIGTNRCIAVEKIIESLQVHCKYAAFGCKHMMQYTKRKRHGHEGVCKFRPYHCPVVGCHLEVPKSGLLDHFLNNHGGETVSYQNPDDDDDPPDEMKNSFTLLTDDVAYDRTNSQYVIVQLSGDQDSEDQDCEEQDSEDQLFLVHHQFHEKYSRYSFSLTSFGTCFSDYSLSVSVEREGHWPGSRKTFKGNHSIEGPVYDNQRDKALLSKVVRQGNCLFIPRLSASQRDSLKFEVEFQIVAR